MLKIYTIFSLQRSKKLVFAFLFTGIATLSFAATIDGDGDGRSKAAAPWKNSGFAPVKMSNSFTLKAGPNYRSSTIFNEERKQPSYLQLNAMVTYQKGNVTYILPRSQKISVSAGKSSLQAVNLKVTLRN